TPPWILPHPDREVGERQKQLYKRLPILQKLSRATIYGMRETMVLGFVVNPRFLKLQETVAKVQLRRQVTDTALRKRLTPDYAIGCKRVLLSSDWRSEEHTSELQSRS